MSNGLVSEHSYFGQKIRCRKEDLSPVPEKVSERWGGGGGVVLGRVRGLLSGAAGRPGVVSFQVSAGWDSWGRGWIPGLWAAGWGAFSSGDSRAWMGQPGQMGQDAKREEECWAEAEGLTGSRGTQEAGHSC